MVTPIIYPITLYRDDDFDLQLNWRMKCGATFALSTYHARMTFWPTKTDRTAYVYQITNPQTAGNGIALDDTSPNIWVHILAANIQFGLAIPDPVTPPKYYVLELQTPTGADPAVDGVWFRLFEGKVLYEP